MEDTALWKTFGNQADILSGAKISSFEDILGLLVHVEMGLDLSKDIFNPFTLKEDSWSHQDMLEMVS